MRRPAAGLGVLGVLLWLLLWLAAGATRAETPVGPPFPDPVAGQTVYDTAGLFSQATIANAEVTIARIEQRTGAEVVVYTS